MTTGDTVTLNADTGRILEVWPDGRHALIEWQPGQSDIAGRTTWCPVVYLKPEKELQWARQHSQNSHAMTRN